MATTAVEVDFFRLLFGSTPGYVCIATQSPIPGDFKQYFYEWPVQEQEMYDFIARWRNRKNIWFCINLLSEKVRQKEYCLETNLVWSDLDEANPDTLDPRPSIVIESSPDRFQAIWRLEHALDSYVAEDYSKRLAYYYAENGADPSGWDLTQLLRVPNTLNMKYEDRPEVKLLRYAEAMLPVEFFDALPEVTEAQEVRVSDAPNLEELPSAEDVIRKHYVKLKRTNFEDRWTMQPTPADDWSKLLWSLIKTCLETGLTPEETYVIAANCNFNKYDRDKRPIKYLWREVNKARKQIESFEAIVSTGLLEMPELIPGQQYGDLNKSFIDEYREWGLKATDAPGQYHDLSGFILLSALLAGNIRCDTNYGSVRPNLWGLIVGDSTLTRKSTAMRMATEIIAFIDKDILIASEGSMEGILNELGLRPGKTSVFFRDEVTGFFDSTRKKDYLAGMPELMTQLYDVPHFFTRRLRKETISVSEPVFIFFGGGIKEKLFSVTDDSYVYSGFFPRFLMVSGDTDLTAIRRTGPPTTESVEQKQAIYSKLQTLYKSYAVPSEVQILDQEAFVSVNAEAILAPDAWELYGDIEANLVDVAARSSKSDVALPTFDRLSKSLLKMAVLLAASRQEPEGSYLEVSKDDVLHAAKYVQDWGHYSIEIISSVGRTVMIRTLERVLRTIERTPHITRGEIMRLTNLSKREMNEIEETLEERGQIRVEKAHGGKAYVAV